MWSDTYLVVFLFCLTDVANSKLSDPWFFFQPFFARSTSLAPDVKEGLDFTNVWNSNYLIPPMRETTTGSGQS
jgi:hypothetical protein